MFHSEECLRVAVPNHHTHTIADVRTHYYEYDTHKDEHRYVLSLKIKGSYFMGEFMLFRENLYFGRSLIGYL